MTEATHGVGPHPQPWPEDAHFDVELLAQGDRRNVPDIYRYWKVEAIKAALALQRIPLEIAIENLERDFSVGTIVRTANAFNVSKLHIIGRRQWNKRGAMMTDAYMDIEYHPDAESFLKAMRERHKQIIAVDIVDGSQPLEATNLPDEIVLVFGSEGPGLSQTLLDGAHQVTHITQTGSTRSINVAVAAGIVMHEWVRRYTRNHDTKVV